MVDLCRYIGSGWAAYLCSVNCFRCNVNEQSVNLDVTPREFTRSLTSMIPDSLPTVLAYGFFYERPSVSSISTTNLDAISYSTIFFSYLPENNRYHSKNTHETLNQVISYKFL